jgi:hypothetical protein
MLWPPENKNMTRGVQCKRMQKQNATLAILVAFAIKF